MMNTAAAGAGAKKAARSRWIQAPALTIRRVMSSHDHRSLLNCTAPHADAKRVTWPFVPGRDHPARPESGKGGGQAAGDEDEEGIFAFDEDASQSTTLSSDDEPGGSALKLVDLIFMEP
mmetsp:Transcript_100247/g.283896  ORF Transcript_100247/g.283896 Transcript_100247/m.283896 type:complete len:119 (-) Transcript_100247:188-544(-)